MSLVKIDGENFYNMMINAGNSLEDQMEYVNSLNVFPVPDGDTGTNMSMTLRSAVDEIKDMKDKSLNDISKALAKGALMGARGNSGVILSQILRGIAKGLENKTEVNAKEFAESLMEGSISAYKAVMRPTEGTILTIVRAAGESAVGSEEEDIIKLMGEVCNHARVMLNKTPDMLPVLKKAKVVDAGGMGLLVILTGMLEALKGNISADAGKGTKASNVNSSAQQSINIEDIKFGYCTEFMVLSAKTTSEEFRSKIESFGDSIIVVGYEDVIKVHIHTNEPGTVLQKALSAGELTKIKIENMREQHRHLLVEDAEVEAASEEHEEVQELKKYGFISVAMGDGISSIFKDLGVDVVIEGGQTMNPSTQDILAAVNSINAENIFVLPNNKNIIMAAKQAAEISEKNVIVIESKSIPQGVTALTEFNADAECSENSEKMAESMTRVTTASVTYAVRDTEMDGVNIKEGDILGIVEGKISEVGNDIYEMCNRLIDKSVNEDSELITIFYGKDCEEEKVNKLLEKLEAQYSDIDVQMYQGNQPLYYFIAAIE
ncbi:DAK2 domain-containing protein [Clostridium sp. 19966]|uniref:DAK2 domain-containing protein n=1 Tax=Clostridium sp. 19966 TaxID=2768166 RepID=UPI0028DF25E4|nr:DAK2 domain-containing protein [Clostridium sp. 19966]MDT8716465.1 DAK2 domain-containing protein [Clostridium sp. 19966]